MKFAQIFVCIMICYHVSQASILIEKVKTNVFDRRPRSFENDVITSMNMTKDFFSRDDVILGVSIGLVVALEYFPFLKNFIQIAPLFQNMLDDRSEWSAAFAKSIVNETSHAIAESEIRWMTTSMQTIRTKIPLLNDSNPDHENRKTIASIIHTDLDRMINFFELKSSLFRKYPLMSGAPLLQLASLVATFSPLANAIIPYEANHTRIACKMHETLLAYRPLMVYARLRRLFTTDGTMYPTLVKVMSLRYNPTGYNRTLSGLIDCDRDCSLNRPRFAIGDEVTCLKDAFSQDDYYVSSYLSPHCKRDYAALLRHRIEDLFPIDVMEKLCDRKSKERTGNILNFGEVDV